jgi:formylglycine-generating enzyme required for sulfatase activity
VREHQKLKRGSQMKRHTFLFLGLPVVLALTLAIGLAAPAPAPQGEEAGTKVVTKVNPKDGLTYVWIPAGKFMMGCSPGDTHCDVDENPHEVTIEKGFWIGQTLVTQSAYEHVMGDNPSFFHGSGQLPVEQVNIVDAHNYCAKVGMRLPHETEWEYAARANNPAERYGELNAIAWYKDNSSRRTHEVAGKEPNAWGLYDMLGNLWEWTSDPYKPDDPMSVVQRGGSWMSQASSVRVSNRGFDTGDSEHNTSGFRCVGEAAALESK